MSLRLARTAGVSALMLGLATLAPAAHAQVQMEVQPVFGDTCVPRNGPTELVVGLANPSTTSITGTLRIASMGPMAASFAGVRTLPSVPFSVGPRARVTVRIQTPPAGLATGDSVLWADDANGRPMIPRPLNFATPTDATLIDATPQARLAFALRGSNGNDPSAPPGLPSMLAGLAAGLSACPALRVPQTGEVVLPRTAAGYNGVALVLIDAASIMALPPADRIPLADYVLSGGSLAIIPNRADELRHPTLQALVGAGVVGVTPAPLDPANGQLLGSVPGIAAGSFPNASTLQGTESYSGGNLHTRALAPLFPWGAPNLLGATADYGFGHVHVLSFNPTMPPALEDPWSVSIVARIAQHANGLRATRVVADGIEASAVPGPVRRALDPNEGFRPGLGLAVILLVLYAIFAGPVSFRLAARRKRPLRGLALLPLFSAVLFGIIVTLGGLSRGFQGHARKLAIMELSAGMPRGAVRRFHGFFSGESGGMELRVHGHDRRLYVDPAGGTGFVTASFERDATVLRGLAITPWTTLVVREEAMEALPGSVTIQPDNAGRIRVVNHTRRALRDVVLIAPGATEGWAFREIRAGESRLATQGAPVATPTLTLLTTGSYVDSGGQVMTAMGPNTSAMHAGSPIALMFGGDGERVRLWDALLASVPGIGAQPSAEPVLVAELVQPASEQSEGGLPVERDATFIRVAGWGGAL